MPGAAAAVPTEWRRSVTGMGGNVWRGMTDEPEEQVSWMAVPAHAPVIASDGQEVGHVLEVAALPEEDIFHGIVFQHSSRGRTYMAPASDIARITNRAVHLSVDSAAAGAYEEFHQLHVSRLGLRGIFRWKHLGWKDSPE
jgi:hypothetical protein